MKEELSNKELLDEVKRLSDLEGSPELVLMEGIDALKETADATLEAIQELADREVPEPESVAPHFEKLSEHVEAVREAIGNIGTDLTPVLDSLSALEAALTGMKMPEFKTDTIVQAIDSLKVAFSNLHVETFVTDVSGIEKKLEPLSKLHGIELEDGRVPVKLSEEDLKQIGKGAASEGIKYVGGAGNGAVFKNIEKIDTLNETVTDALSTYKLTDIDDTTATEYYGYVDKDGNWYIKKATTTAIRFIKGASDYTTNWTGRAGLTYSYFYETF